MTRVHSPSPLWVAGLQLVDIKIKEYVTRTPKGVGGVFTALRGFVGGNKGVIFYFY